MKKKNWFVLLMLMIMFSGIVFSTLTSVHIINEILIKSKEQRTRIVSERVHYSVMNSMIRPITVSETMAHDGSLIKLMEMAGKSKPQEAEAEMAEYLESIRSGFGYRMVFAVCDKTKAYYTYDGLGRIMEPDKSSDDSWYERFQRSGKYYDLNVDTDRANNWDLYVFVNIQVRNKKGEFLGICGVGVEMTKLQEILEDCEKDYDVKINLTDHEKLIQVDTDRNQIENSCLEVGNYSTQKKDEFIVERNHNTMVLSNYMADLDWYLIIQDRGTHSVNVLEIVWPCIVILLIGMLAMAIIFGMIHYQKKQMAGVISKKVEVEKKQMDILTAMSGIYLTTHVINLKEDTVEEIKIAENVRFKVNLQERATSQMAEAIRNNVELSYLEAALLFTDLTTLRERMKHMKILVEQFVGRYNGWFRAQFIANSYDEDGNVETVIFTTQIIDAEKKQEEMLVRISLTDELTGLYNRRAYEIHLKEVEMMMPENLVVISMDLNGLKLANDTKGHEAGDELIKGAAVCMMNAFIDYGRIYRTGGDEFIAILQLEKEELFSMLDKFQKNICRWYGDFNSKMSISCGVVTHKEYPKMGINELAAIADKYMYDDKNEYYKCCEELRRK